MRKLVGLGMARSIPTNLNAVTLFLKNKTMKGKKKCDKMGCLLWALSLTSSARQKKKKTKKQKNKNQNKQKSVKDMAVLVQDVVWVSLIGVDAFEPSLNFARAQDRQCSELYVIPNLCLEAESQSQSKVSLYAHSPWKYDFFFLL
jgi:hypothetical protein